MEKLINCPDCCSTKIVKNGSISNGKQKYKCKRCGRQFVLDPQKQPISNEQKAAIDRLLLERISLFGIARSVKVSERWLQDYVNEKYDPVPRKIVVSKKNKGPLTIECDELWSFVGKKSQKQWIWLALDRKTREIVGVFLGNRSRQSARKLWDS